MLSNISQPHSEGATKFFGFQNRPPETVCEHPNQPYSGKSLPAPLATPPGRQGRSHTCSDLLLGWHSECPVPCDEGAQHPPVCPAQIGGGKVIFKALHIKLPNVHSSMRFHAFIPWRPRRHSHLLMEQDSTVTDCYSRVRVF